MDLIDRHVTIDALEETDWYHQNRSGEMVHGANSDEDQAWYKAEDVYGVLERMSSVHPERNKGKWRDFQEHGFVICPFCGSATNCDGDKEDLHFCFNCGADMREENR